MREPMSPRFNWQLWSGFALSVAAFASYFLFFIRFPITRDMPWVTLILFVIAIVLLVIGLRKAAGRRVLAWIVTIPASAAIAALAYIMVGWFA